MAHVQTRFIQALHRLGGPEQLQVPADELVQRYPPAPSSSTTVDLDACEFYRDFATAPADVNAQRDDAVALARATHGSAHVDAILRSHQHHAWKKRRQFDFRLKPRETEQLAREGVVVAQRLHAESFAEGYYRLYTDDLPVYITTDSILHAWHRSFDAVLVDMETLACVPLLTRVLQAASTRCHELLEARADSGTSGNGGRDRSTRVLLDVDLFVAVALRLLLLPASPVSAGPGPGVGPGAGPATSGQHGLTSPRFPANATRAAALERLIATRQLATVTLFESERDVDFSLFQPRGHYTQSKELSRYFQAMAWLGIVDLRIANDDPTDDGTDDPIDVSAAPTTATTTATGARSADSALYQLQCAIVLVGLLRQDGGLQTLSTLDALVSSLVGDGDVGADSLTPLQLETLLPASLSCTALLATYIDGESEDGVTGNGTGSASPSALLALQQEIVAKGLGAQLITGHPYVESGKRGGGAGTTPTMLPTSFAFFGQRFVWSSFVFSRLVFDQVVHGAENQVVRRLPSAVDIGFALLANDAAGAIAARRMQQQPRGTDSTSEPTDSEDAELRTAAEFVRLRDGVPYASNLIALREAIDAEFDRGTGDDSATAGHADDGAKPASVSTLWLCALRQLSTPSTNAAPVFHSQTWQLRQLNTQLASFAQLRHDSLLYAKQSFTMGTRCEYAAGFVDPYPAFYASMRTLAERMAAIVHSLVLTPLSTELASLRDKGECIFTTFADTMRTLEEIATRQAQKQPLSDEQTDFVKTVMEERFGSGATKYAGWYPQLFYTRHEDAGERDVLVADVHTDVPSVEHGDPLGGVLHVGVGDVHFGFFAVDGAVYSGPVFSSYEVVTASASERLDDDAFKDRLADTGNALSAPDWALGSFLC